MTKSISFDFENQVIKRATAKTHARWWHQPVEVSTKSTDTDFMICSQKDYKEFNYKKITGVYCPNNNEKQLGIFRIYKNTFNNYLKKVSHLFEDTYFADRFKGDLNLPENLTDDLLVPLILFHNTQEKVRIGIDNEETKKIILDCLIGSYSYLIFDFKNRTIKIDIASEDTIFDDVFEDSPNYIDPKLKKEAEELQMDQDNLIKLFGEDGTVLLENVKVRSQVVQTHFRNGLIERDHKCIFCKLSQDDLLIASHIKPAAISNVFEKADINNGLLLCPNHDKLFDRGYISFNAIDGNLLISNLLDENSKRIIGLHSITGLSKDVFNEKMSKYLIYHNNEVFKK